MARSALLTSPSASDEENRSSDVTRQTASGWVWDFMVDVTLDRRGCSALYYLQLYVGEMIWTTEAFCKETVLGFDAAALWARYSFFLRFIVLLACIDSW